MIFVKDQGIWKEAGASVDPFIPGTPMEGGFFFGFHEIGSDKYALIVADSSATEYLRWKTGLTLTAGTESLVDGWANTNAMNDAQHPAAQYCRSYSGGGHNDWYLPARNELAILRNNLATDLPLLDYISPDDFASGGDQAFINGYFWSSSQNAAGNSWRVTVSQFSSSSGSSSKNQNHRVLPIRRVLISA